MPVPRRFDRRPPERDPTRINERIRVPEVRLIGEDGEQIGVLKIDDALRYAQERDLDLVEVAPEAKPPVCRVLDYSKYKYEQAQKQKQARKHQQQITIREIKFRPKIAQHDYDTKKGHVERFLRHKDKVKVTIMFRGREVTHPERGVAILDRLAEELAEFGDRRAASAAGRAQHDDDARPLKAVLAGHFDKPPRANGAPRATPRRCRDGPNRRTSRRSERGRGGRRRRRDAPSRAAGRGQRLAEPAPTPQRRRPTSAAAASAPTARRSRRVCHTRRSRCPR